MSYYYRHLPHWQPEGAALFITWRLQGSLPKEVVVPPNCSSGKTFAAFDRELHKAATGPRWLQNERVAEAVINAIRHGEQPLGLYDLRAWVLMVNHVHLLIYPRAGLSKITKAIKNFSARHANTYDHWVRTPDELERIVRYIEWNPVAAGLALRPETRPWSSAFGLGDGQARKPVLL